MEKQEMDFIFYSGKKKKKKKDSQELRRDYNK